MVAIARGREQFGQFLDFSRGIVPFGNSGCASPAHCLELSCVSHQSLCHGRNQWLNRPGRDKPAVNPQARSVRNAPR